MSPARPRTILLTGATGYVGGRLLRRLLSRGELVRCLARRPEDLAQRTSTSTEIVAADVLDSNSLVPALKGVQVAYYLIHSMGDTGDFAAKEQEAAHNFAAAAREAGVERIVYLGGLGRRDLSPHLASRQRVGDIFRSSGVPTVELRCSVIIGSGSASFEMVRALVDRLPVMITPSWVHVRTQPIAIEDILDYPDRRSRCRARRQPRLRGRSTRRRVVRGADEGVRQTTWTAALPGLGTGF